MMKTWVFLPVLAVGLMLTTMPGLAQDRDKADTPAKEAPTPEASGSPKTGGDERPSAVDPAQAKKTGANTGDGASYNRSNEKGDSALPKEGAEKTK